MINNLFAILAIKNLGFIGPYYPNPEWSLVHSYSQNVVYVYPNGQNFSSVEFGIKLQRKTSIHMYYFIIPYLTASFLGLTIFLMPIGSNSRFIFGGLAITILTMMLVFLGLSLGFHSIRPPYAGKLIINMLI